MRTFPFIIGLTWLALLPGIAPSLEAAEPLKLVPEGTARTLEQPSLGASAEALVENLLNDSHKVDISREMNLAFVRFPGGSQSNYYNWKTGLIEFDAQPDSSGYVKFWAGVAPKIAAFMPDGVHFPEYLAYCRKIGAQPIFMPNLETSSIKEQSAWFADLKQKGIAPHHVELGNEFYLAMLADPASMRRWPDSPTTMKTMHAYAQALATYCEPGTKFAIQSAGSSFWVSPQEQRPFLKRQLDWDAALNSKPWFQAVSVHLYPQMASVMGQAAAQNRAEVTPEYRQRAFTAVAARFEQGTDRALGDIEKRFPGKEIWLTEWNARGGEPTGDLDPATPDMLGQLSAKMQFSILRHPAVTASLYFMLNFSPRSIFSIFVPDGAGGFSKMPVAVVLQWFDEAANHGGTFQRLVQAGAAPVPGGGAWSESYREVEAALFIRGNEKTLLLQNLSSKAISYHPEQGVPKSVEILACDHFLDPTKRPAQIQSSAPATDLSLPPYSLARLRW